MKVGKATMRAAKAIVKVSGKKGAKPAWKKFRKSGPDVGALTSLREETFAKSRRTGVY